MQAPRERGEVGEAALPPEALPDASDGPAVAALDGDVAVECIPGEDDGRELKIHLARRLAETRVVIDRVLETISGARLEARRLVTQELGVDPRPEILNTIVKIACDPCQSGTRRELPRHLLTAHSLIETESTRLLQDPELNADLIAESGRVLPELLDLARRIQNDISSTLHTLPEDERDYLLRICNSLRVPEGQIAAALILGPRVALFTRRGASGTLREDIPVLSGGEAEFVTRLATTGTTENTPGRTCLNAVALRTLMVEDIETWRDLCSKHADAEGNVAVPTELRVRMEREKIAFHHLSEELQGKQDTALVAGLASYAEELRAFRQSLFASYLEFAPAQRGAAAGKADSGAPVDDSVLSQLVEESLMADAAADAARAKETSKEELYLKALTDMRKPEGAARSTDEPDGAAHLRAERRRKGALFGTAGVLIVVCLGVYIPLLLRPAPPPEVSVADFAGATALTQGIAAGGAMYSQISDWDWAELSAAERQAKLEELGRIARSRGLEMMFLADGSGRELGHWSVAGGAVLTETSDGRSP